MEKGLVFVVGGARSGKSAHALELASARPGPKVYIATAQALDAEMAERIEAHRKERGSTWETVEEPLEVGAAVSAASAGVVVIDCLTLWLTNLMGSGMDDSGVRERAASLAGICSSSPSLVIAVSNEVGLGLVPDNPLARRFRDLSGRMNQEMASRAAQAWFVASGIPMKLK